MTSQNERRVAEIAIGGVGLVRAERFEAIGWLAADALVELGVGVTELDRDIPQLLSEQSHSLHDTSKRMFRLQLSIEGANKKEDYLHWYLRPSGPGWTFRERHDR